MALSDWTKHCVHRKCVYENDIRAWAIVTGNPTTAYQCKQLLKKKEEKIGRREKEGEKERERDGIVLSGFALSLQANKGPLGELEFVAIFSSASFLL